MKFQQKNYEITVITKFKSDLFSLSTCVPRLLLISWVSFIISPVHAALCSLLRSFSRTSYPPDDWTREDKLPWRLPMPPALLDASPSLRLLPNLKNFFIILLPDMLLLYSTRYRPLHIKRPPFDNKFLAIAAVAGTCCIAYAQYFLSIYSPKWT